MAKTPKITHPAKNAHEVPTGKGIISDVKEIIGMANAPEGHPVLAKSRADVPINPEAQVSVSQKELGHIENNISVGGGPVPVNKVDIVSSAPNHNASAVTPNGKPSQPAEVAEFHGDPVSLFSGEELLTLTDFTLPGVLPFAWRRLYRTSAVEQRAGMGPGWTHSASPYLFFDRDGQSQEEIVWFFDDESRGTRFLLPTQKDPVVTNRAGGGVISLKMDEFSNEYCVQFAGGQGTYHFLRDGDMAWLRCIRDRHDNSVDVSYDSEGRLAAIGHDDARLCFSYDDPAYPKGISQVLLQARNPGSTSAETHWQRGVVVAHYCYNEHQQLISATNAAGDTEHYRYRDDHVILCRTLAGGAEFHWEWQGEGKDVRCLRQYGNFGQLDTRYHWDEASHSVTLTHQDGSQQRYRHSAQALLLLEKNADGAETHYEYNDDGACIRVTDALGYHTDSVYGNDGALQCVITPDGQVTSYDWLFDQLFSRTQGVGDEAQIWRYTYYPDGALKSETGPAGTTTYYSYTPRGQVSQIRFPDGSEQHLQWDTLGRLLSDTSPQGSRQLRYQGLQTQPSEVKENDQITRYQWDELDRLIKITHPDGSTRQYQYNAYGKVTQLTDEAGRVTQYHYAAPLHLLTEKRLPDGGSLRYRYDNVHLQVSEIENQHGEKYRLGYTGSGLLSEEVGFDNSKTTYHYDACGRLSEKHEYGNDHQSPPFITQYQRDPLGRLTRKILPDGKEEEYRYDEAGRLSEVLDDENPLAWQYDAAGRLEAEHQSWATMRYRYDEDTGRLNGIKQPNGQWQEFHYQHGKLQASSLEGQPLTAYGYDHHQRLQQLRQGNRLVNRFQYDLLGRLSLHSLREPGIIPEEDRLHWQQQYAYQADGELASIEGNDARQYHYNTTGALTSVSYLNPQSIIPPARQPVHRLPQFQPAAAAKEQHHANPNESFRWDQRGNPVSDLQQHSVPGNRLAFYADRHFEYDRFGNLTAERRGKAQRLVTRYEYDCRHRLIRHETPDGSVSTYSYDAFNRRLSKTVNGKLLEFVWRGNQLVAETDGKGYWQSYLYEPGSYRPMALVVGEPSRDPKDKPPAIYWYQNDHLGTPHELTDWNGNSVWKGRFSAFGQIREEWQAEDASAINQPLRFQGQYADKESGLYYNLNRYYDPGVGRYLTADPIKLAGGLNAYQYVYGNPANWIDPTGLTGMPRAPGQIYKDPVTGVNTVHMGNGPIGQSDLDRLAFDTAKGKNIFHEAEAAIGLEKAYGGVLERIPSTVDANGKTIPDADFIFASGPMQGKKIDFLWTLDNPGSVQKMNEMFQKPKFLRMNEGQLLGHLEKADIVPLDYRNLTPNNQQIVNQWILKLEPIQKSQILIMKD
ncbi:RHS repeat-associated core domain-containing protein [Serratia sp. JSRIV006]|uniref:RHS repeat-associated core domain-containing protein n=1 Tax=Serratia sp. JSRIV006 TaxID=2831896 RepID=UPI001CBBB54B|nr:RHS repeat-associated core domain-containing protein [Serratia sp. JSRIV006]UAN62452.1 RHS domain-containing protein [Serratia sp. JSRIV006]